jgi:hypothetical protein
MFIPDDIWRSIKQFLFFKHLWNDIPYYKAYNHNISYLKSYFFKINRFNPYILYSPFYPDFKGTFMKVSYLLYFPNFMHTITNIIFISLKDDSKDIHALEYELNYIIFTQYPPSSLFLL